MILNKYVVHVLDKENETLILNDFEGKIRPDVEKFIKDSIRKVSRKDDNQKLKFRNYNSNIVKECCEDVIYNKSNFIENSKEIASYLFDSMEDSGMKSCDLVVALYTVKDQQKVAILTIDFKSQYTHSIEFVNDKFSVNVVENNNIISSSKVSNAAIIGVSGANDEYHLRGKGNDYFIKNCLESVVVEDDSYKTKMFDVISKYILTNYTTDVKECLDLLDYRDYVLKEKFELDVDEFIDNMKGLDANIIVATAIEQELENKNIAGTFEIDKKYIENKIKKRTLKTDTGFKIESNVSDMNDPLKFRLTQNENGSYDLIIRNIKYIR